MQVWYDPRLTWNRSDYAMTKQIHVDPDKIWVPDLKVYNEYVPRAFAYADAAHLIVILI